MLYIRCCQPYCFIPSRKNRNKPQKKERFFAKPWRNCGENEKQDSNQGLAGTVNGTLPVFENALIIQRNIRRV
jgi:hypothetical protein